MKGKDISFNEVVELLQVKPHEAIPFSATYDEQELGGSEWHCVVGVFNTVEAGPQFNKLSHARKCDAARKLLEHSTLMNEVHVAYKLFRDIAFDNDEKTKLPAGPLFQFDNGINPLAWARPPRRVTQYPVVRITDDEDYLRLEGPWFQFDNTTDPAYLGSTTEAFDPIPGRLYALRRQGGFRRDIYPQ